ncbi:hypothetical protein FNF27_06738 [Cafeteria roenbergensis]|uniref:phosphoethanolamine N-methyltransferase n=1 Tax=Cafeteria roenbergensis TaxID=33653 RepID=A0A5A8DXG4_CAFRO|nr:hypothetical protein FNF27_06738 [Cafeteria roenbergensis]
MDEVDGAALPLAVMPTEAQLFATRASVYDMRYGDSGEAFWHKRGTGKLQVLQNAESRLVRIFALDRKSRRPVANFALLPSMSMVACAQADSSRGAGNAWVAKVHDYSAGRHEEVHLAMRIKAIPLVPEFLEAVKLGKAENAKHPSALAALFKSQASGAADGMASPSPTAASHSPSAAAAAAAGARSGAAEADDLAAMMASPASSTGSKPLQMSPAASPRPMQDLGALEGQHGVEGADGLVEARAPLAARMATEEVAGSASCVSAGSITFEGTASPGDDTVSQVAAPGPRRHAPSFDRGAAASDSPAAPAAAPPGVALRLAPPYSAAAVADLQRAFGAGRMSPGGAALSSRCAAALGNVSGGRLLDLGCGAGVPSTELAEATGATVVAIDSSRDAIAAARSICDNPAVEFRVCDAAAAPTESFDGAVARCLLSQVADALPILTQAAACLAPGATLVVVDRILGPTADVNMSTVEALAARGLHLRSLAAVRQELERAGFVVVGDDSEAASEDTLASLRASSRSLHAQIKATQTEGDPAGDLPAFCAELSTEVGRIAAGITGMCLLRAVVTDQGQDVAAKEETTTAQSHAAALPAEPPARAAPSPPTVAAEAKAAAEAQAAAEAKAAAEAQAAAEAKAAAEAQAAAEAKAAAEAQAAAEAKAAAEAQAAAEAKAAAEAQAAAEAKAAAEAQAAAEAKAAAEAQAAAEAKAAAEAQAAAEAKAAAEAQAAAEAKAAAEAQAAAEAKAAAEAQAAAEAKAAAEAQAAARAECASAETSDPAEPAGPPSRARRSMEASNATADPSDFVESPRAPPADPCADVDEVVPEHTPSKETQSAAAVATAREADEVTALVAKVEPPQQQGLGLSSTFAVGVTLGVSALVVGGWLLWTGTTPADVKKAFEASWGSSDHGAASSGAGAGAGRSR